MLCNLLCIVTLDFRRDSISEQLPAKTVQIRVWALTRIFQLFEKLNYTELLFLQELGESSALELGNPGPPLSFTTNFVV